MKSIVLFPILFLLSITSFSQLPTLVGMPASIENLKDSYRSYTVEKGKLMDARTYGDADFYVNARITGKSFEYTFKIESNALGIVTSTMYLYDNLSDDYYNILKRTLILVHKAKSLYQGDGTSIYYSTLFGNQNIYFDRRPNNIAIVTFKLKD